VTNIPVPYRNSVFDILSESLDIDFSVIYLAELEPDRKWKLSAFKHRHFNLKPRFLTIGGRFIHFNLDVLLKLRELGPDVVVTTGFNPSHLLAFLYALWSGATHVAMTDGTLESEQGLTSIHRFVRRIVYKRTKAFVGPSDGSAALYLSYGVDQKSIFKSHLCANNEQFSLSDDGLTIRQTDFLFSGRFVDAKNPLFAIEVAAAAARQLGRIVSLSFMGSGPLEGAILALANHLKNVVEVRLLGFVEQADLPAHFANAKVFLFPTSSDVWGVVANEACAAGLPVITTPAAGVAGEIVRDGFNGYVLELNVEAWANAGCRLLNDAARYREYSQRSRDIVRPYSYSNAAAGLEAAIRYAAGLPATKAFTSAPNNVGLRPRVLIVHNSYQQRGGEDGVVEAEIALLRARGHEVSVYTRSNDDIATMSKASAAVQTLWSQKTSREFASLVQSFRPDVIHVHNTFPLISPSLYWAASKARVPIVQTLHNFRLLCPQAMFLREGKVCEDCLGKLPWRGAVRGCYRGSKVQSTLLAGMVTVHRAIGTWQNKVTRYIALNDFCRNKFIEGGLPADRIVVKPNFVDFEAPATHARSGFLFVGRLSAEKGVDVLVNAARAMGSAQVRVAGTGPEAGLLAGVPGVQALGALGGDAVRGEMSQAMALVLPSICYENFPRTLVEAFGSCTPVIASRHGAMAELVQDGITGLLFEPGNAQDLADKLRWAQAHPENMAAMGRNARALYEAEFTADRNYAQLIAIYNDAIAAGSAS